MPSSDPQPPRKILQPGWAGELSDSEVEFIRRRLSRSPKMWRKWGYLGSMLKGVSIPAATIRRIARHGIR